VARSPAAVHLLLQIQDSVLGTWLRESAWGLFALLILHTIGMAFFAGTALAMLVRLLGFATHIALTSVGQLMPLHHACAALALASGALLTVAYPAKALTNPLFYAKLALLLCAWWLTRSLLRQALQLADGEIPTRRIRVLAGVALLLWSAGITTGRLLAYTHTHLLIYA
jgi:hypothetical protein